ncbi:L,D-transpeptidase family protein [Bacillus thermocopriae]|uniref:L,D-transpeptidase family protein n=1 Tax=Neobacillus thermocopriae TaxID=1215031 RepID=A0A6B3TP36_9BACI|nr:L,D-transpeptidase family protein [Neobacillus thermocopriae]NEX77891.1 L,D-transpeptidase family protein [Neobacillus thermocopriae]
MKLENAALQESMGQQTRQHTHSTKWFKNWKFITASSVIVIGILLGALSYYQTSHFNAQVKINGVHVGGMTAEEALHKLTSSELKNTIYIGDQQILDGNDTKMAFTTKDLPAVEKLLKSQWSFFPSSKEKNLFLKPNSQDEYRTVTLKKQLEEKLISLNGGLKAPIDAQARLEDGKIVITESVGGEQYDVAGLLKEYDKHGYTSEIKLKPLLLQPITADSEIVKKQEKMLQELLGRTVNYKVQNKVYTLKANELIKKASVSKENTITIEETLINQKVDEINAAQSTLNKPFTFKTHSGAVITVQGKGYGWALDAKKETALIAEAFAKGETDISAANIKGHGWKGEGYGYETLTNNGIGDTYAEVSIKDQRLWIYKNGKMVFTTHVVTGTHSTGEDTDKGVWYILYKKKDDILNGSRVGGGEYAVHVDYWVPFTNSGQGFHDASWRTNWSPTAYLNAGSGGCVNIPPKVMKTVFDNLETYEPVVVY